MLADPKLSDEEGRLAALMRQDILDTPKEAPFEKVTTLIRSVLNVQIAAVSFIDGDRHWFKSCHGLPLSQCARQDSFCSTTIRQHAPLVIHDLTLDPRFADNVFVAAPNGARSYLGVPLPTPDGYNIGSLCIIDTVPRVFTQSEIDIVATFARLICDEIELRQIASNDGLTGAMTRRSWIAAAYREFDAARHSGAPVSIVMFDIDHFKSVNDTYGHGAGDTVLRDIAGRCFGQSRDCDLLGRLGGEEFALLLPATGVSRAVEVADRVRRAIGGRAVKAKPCDIAVTASFGIGTRTGAGQMPEELLNHTDLALYAAKQNGRDCCIVR